MCIEEQENSGFYDAVGGYHIDAIGYSPTGEWCGECCNSTCEDCKVHTKKGYVTE